jgi:hypothetical protein
MHSFPLLILHNGRMLKVLLNGNTTAIWLIETVSSSIIQDTRLPMVKEGRKSGVLVKHDGLGPR